MYEIEFAKRLYALRTQKGVSARDMSLSLGQSESYINKIENGKTFPSMQVFFYICEYLQLAPTAFFDMNVENPQAVQKICRDLCALPQEHLHIIEQLVQVLRQVPNVMSAEQKAIFSNTS